MTPAVLESDACIQLSLPTLSCEHLDMDEIGYSHHDINLEICICSLMDYNVWGCYVCVPPGDKRQTELLLLLLLLYVP